jgi:phage terminase small subunit
MKEFWLWAHSQNHKELTSDKRLILVKACEAFDEAERCRRIIKKEGMVVEDRFKQRKPHPLLTIEQNSRMQFSKLLDHLYLHVLTPWPSKTFRPD